MTTRFGLFGTGPWASDVHGPALVSSPGVEVTGVWGRNPDKAAALADRLGCRAYADVDALIADVEAVAVALPPDVQAPIAERAARAGRHLLLDKPLALTTAAAGAVVDAVESAGVASVVFFTSRYRSEVATWLASASGQDWSAASACYLGSIFQPGNPFGASPWRRDKGGLWDIGPHALAVTLPLMGPVAEVAAAVRDRDDTVHVVLRHDSGAVSTLALGLDAPPAAAATSFRAWGPAGWTTMPEAFGDAVSAYREAVRQLLSAVAAQQPQHPCDVRFAATVVDVLERAQTRLSETGVAAAHPR